MYDGSWYNEQEKPIFNTQKVTVPRLSKDGKDLQLYISQESVQSALLATLRNRQVTRRTLWIKTDLIEDIMGGVRESFGDNFEMIKVIVEAQDIESAKVTLTKEHGTVVELKNKFVLENPTVTEDPSDDTEMPFIEVEMTQRLSINFTQYNSEILDFSISAIGQDVENYGIYYQSEAELPTDDEARKSLTDLLINKYIDDVNSVYNQVSLDEETGHNQRDKVRVNLPIHTMLLKSIDNVQISIHDGFLLIEADPKKFDKSRAIMNF